DIINYIPYDIKYFFTDLMAISSNKYDNKAVSEIFNLIKGWCKKFGMPFWTDRKKLANYITPKRLSSGEFFVENIFNTTGILPELHESAKLKITNIITVDPSVNLSVDDIVLDKEGKTAKVEVIDANIITVRTIKDLSRSELSKQPELPEYQCSSEYETNNNTIPINNLIFISLAMYMFKNLWEYNINDERGSKNKQDELNDIVQFMGINCNDITGLFEKADHFHNYIMEKCNSIFELDLKIEHKKIPYENKGTVLFYNETIYESAIIAAWDTFYHYYLGNSNLDRPLPYCSECSLEIAGKPHTIETKTQLCDDCFNKRASELNRNRVAKHRTS
ncbi:MAG: hypothetical protein PHO63_02975, partial [Bacilli bacterium]|nr:hypothetical protein [Bacilli bacterium]